MSDAGKMTLVDEVREVRREVSIIWADIYGDKDRREAGLLHDFRGVASAINRLTIVLVFFSMISMLTLMAVIWVVLSL